MRPVLAQLSAEDLFEPEDLQILPNPQIRKNSSDVRPEDSVPRESERPAEREAEALSAPAACSPTAGKEYPALSQEPFLQTAYGRSALARIAHQLLVRHGDSERYNDVAG